MLRLTAQAAHAVTVYEETAPGRQPFALGHVLTREEDRLVCSGEEFSLTSAQLAVHMAVLGNSGSGKSKFLELLLRQYLVDHHPFALWDPHGDLTKALLSFVAARKADGDDVLWRKVHSLELSPDSVFSYDPVARAPLRSQVGTYAYFQWMKTRIDRLCQATLRRLAEASQDVMVRLKRWLKTVFWACLVALDDRNTHVGLHKALVFTDPQHEEFDALYAKVSPHLPSRVRRNFKKLLATKRPQDQEKWVESTINKLEELLSPLTEAVYSQARPPVDIRGIVERGEFLLIDLKQTEYFSHDEKVTLGGFLLVDVLAAKEAEESLPEDERREYTVVIDESGELLGDDLKRWLGATRKYRCPIILGAQDLSTFARGDLDMAAKVLTMCGTVVCFANTYLEDKRLLADRIGCGNLDFTPRVVEVQRQRGDRVLQLDEVSESLTEGENWNSSTTRTESKQHAQSVSQALALSNNWSDDGTPARGSARKGGGQTATAGSSASDTSARSMAHASSLGGNRTRGQSIAHKTLILPNIVSEWEEDGTLAAGPIEQQRARLEQQIHTLGVGQAAIAVRGRAQAFIAQIAAVEEWWENGRDKYEAIARLKQRLSDLHGYYFHPGTGVALAPDAEAKRADAGGDGRIGELLAAPQDDEKNPWE